MKIVQAVIPDFESVRRIVQTTIWSIYPRYYPSGAVVFFARHHSDESIAPTSSLTLHSPQSGFTENGDFLCYDVMRKTV